MNGQRIRLNTEQAALFLGLKPGTLEVWRSSGRYDLPFVKVGRRVFYLKDDLETWLETRRQTRTT